MRIRWSVGRRGLVHYERLTEHGAKKVIRRQEGLEEERLSEPSIRPHSVMCRIPGAKHVGCVDHDGAKNKLSGAPCSVPGWFGGAFQAFRGRKRVHCSSGGSDVQIQITGGTKTAASAVFGKGCGESPGIPAKGYHRQQGHAELFLQQRPF